MFSRTSSHLELKVSASHHGHVLLFAELGVPHGQVVVLILYFDQFVVVIVPLFFHFVVSLLERQQLNLVEFQLLPLIFHLARFGQEFTALGVLGLDMLLQLDDLIHQKVSETLVSLFY